VAASDGTVWEPSWNELGQNVNQVSARQEIKQIMKALDSQNLRHAAAAIQAADALLITAGAGMGVDSGLPDFRGKDGFWRAYPVIAQLGLSFAEIANPVWFKDDPQLAWAFYGHRLNLYRATTPHEGFTKLLTWGADKPEGCFVFTSNVDGQFQKAGFAPERIVECHGSIHHFQCTETCSDAIWEAADEHVWLDEGNFRARTPLPRCRHCGNLARPNILMFGDSAWIGDRSAAQHQRFEVWMQRLEKKSAKLLVIELGAGTAIATVRRTSEIRARNLNGTLIRINPREPEAPAGQISLPTGALDGIKKLAQSMDTL